MKKKIELIPCPKCKDFNPSFAKHCMGCGYKMPMKKPIDISKQYKKHEIESWHTPVTVFFNNMLKTFTWVTVLIILILIFSR